VELCQLRNVFANLGNSVELVTIETQIGQDWEVYVRLVPDWLTSLVVSFEKVIKLVLLKFQRSKVLHVKQRAWQLGHVIAYQPKFG
jgi:hypothetical protein